MHSFLEFLTISVQDLLHGALQFRLVMSVVTPRSKKRANDKSSNKEENI